MAISASDVIPLSHDRANFSELAEDVRACSKSFEQQSQECQMDELQAGVQQPLAVLAQPPVLLQPGKAALYHPTLGHHLERMQFTALGDLYRDVSAAVFASP